MEYTVEDLREAKRQVDSTIHKLKETLSTLETKENAAKLKSQITLARRRVVAFEIASHLLEEKIRGVEDT